MKNHSTLFKRYDLRGAFTIVELIVVVVVISILVTITAAGFNSWRSRTATTEVTTDASGVQAGMEDVRNRKNGYAVFPIGTEFDGSDNGTKNIFIQNKNVRIIYAGGDANSYCVDIQSKAVPSVHMFLDTTGGNQVAKNGTCDGGEDTTPPDAGQTVFVFNTAASGCGGTVQLPVLSPASGGTIDWGDGTVEARTTALQSHTYTTAKTYVATFTGSISEASYYYSVDATKAKCLTKVTQWSTSIAPTFVSFFNATNLVYVAEPPHTVTNMAQMFAGATSFNQPINGWDVSKVTNMDGMFSGAAIFNQPLSSWNTSKVTSMSHIFNRAYAFNQPLSSWDVSKVTNMMGMFYAASIFNQPLSTWNTSAATTMGSMFREATAFNQAIGGWNTANVTDLGYMFSGAEHFNQPIGAWNTSKVTTMSQMFSNALTFNQPLSSWNTALVTAMDWMFNNTAFNQNISGWSVGNVTNKTAFHATSPLTQANCPPSLW